MKFTLWLGFLAVAAFGGIAAAQQNHYEVLGFNAEELNVSRAMIVEAALREGEKHIVLESDSPSVRKAKERRLKAIKAATDVLLSPQREVYDNKLRQKIRAKSLQQTTPNPVEEVAENPPFVESTESHEDLEEIQKHIAKSVRASLERALSKASSPGQLLSVLRNMEAKATLSENAKRALVRRMRDKFPEISGRAESAAERLHVIEAAELMSTEHPDIFSHWDFQAAIGRLGGEALDAKVRLIDASYKNDGSLESRRINESLYTLSAIADVMTKAMHVLDFNTVDRAKQHRDETLQNVIHLGPRDPYFRALANMLAEQAFAEEDLAIKVRQGIQRTQESFRRYKKHWVRQSQLHLPPRLLAGTATLWGLHSLGFMPGFSPDLTLLLPAITAISGALTVSGAWLKNKGPDPQSLEGLHFANYERSLKAQKQLLQTVSGSDGEEKSTSLTKSCAEKVRQIARSLFSARGTKASSN